ncbi:hypothetical protein F5884DRAFT_835489 [Xylogone sp. PMI_703]|nr:hypothetical protein F5884DRAFT_835489 [Xylogone sp. PMI_703]
MASTTMMKAWQYDNAPSSIETSLELRSLPALSKSSLSKGQLLVEVIYASLNPLDYKVAELGGLMRRAVISLPAIPGLDFCGRVTETYNDHTGFKKGMLVFGALGKPSMFGTLGQFIVVSTSECVPLPDGVDPSQAAATGCAALTAYQSLAFAKFSKERPGVFINGGSGGVGTFAIQFAKLKEAYVVTTCSTRNIGLCQSLGADKVIDHTKADVLVELQKEGQVFDLVIDGAGTPQTLYKHCHTFLRRGATFVQVSAALSPSGFISLLGKMMQPGFLGGGRRPFHFFTVSSN